MVYLFLLFALMGCSSSDTPEATPVVQSTGYPYCDAQKDSERLAYYLKGLLNNLPLVDNGINGQFTSICATTYKNTNGCSVSCSLNSGFYSSVVLTCDNDSKTPTGFVTTSCEDHNFSQALQGKTRITGTRLDENTVTFKIEYAGGMYKLNRNGTYSTEGICSNSVSGISHFMQSGKKLTYLCAHDSSVMIDEVENNCSSIKQSYIDSCQ